ncbi:hypothetical protein GGS23DRAFT_578075 [Durotheca rogersii]|uniref:uncharacterized protein n=1 Tax=Durotheca rogersii TaxID=419775 RepID=UPI002220526E|nr:uncharacterized protein GGS23DRAFT_578075 [Durotheca rogersii]KAI5860945.1 hypothetical protein GGS23DRAFT_578075 [Durotheca rogersii]
MASPSKKKTEITEKESQVLALAWKCFKTNPEVDLNKLAKLAGYTNPRSVANVLSAVRKKIAASISEDAEGDSDSVPVTPVKRGPRAKGTPASSSRKRKEPADSAGNGGDESPSKRARGSKEAAPAAVAAAAAPPVVKDEPDDAQHVNVKLEEDAPYGHSDGDDDAVVD